MNLIKNIKSRVSSFFSSEELIVVDENNRILFFDENFNLKRGFRLKLLKNNPNEKGVKFSSSGNFLLIAVKNYLTLWDIKNKKHLANFKLKYSILSVGFSKDDKYFACGDIDGRIVVFNFKLKKEIFSLKHRDFIMDLDFNSDRSYLFAGSYDKGIIFFNLITLNKKERFLHTKPVKKIEEKNYLVSSDENAYTIKWNEKSYKYKDILKIYSNFRDFFVYKNYLILGLERKVLIYNLEDEVIENENFLTLNEIDKVVVFKDYLVISTLSGEIYNKYLFEEEKEFLDFVIKEEYKKAFELIDKNPFLKFSKGYEKLNQLIELKIKEALKLFEIDKTEALKILDKLIIVPSLKKRIENIIKQYENFERFVFAIKNKNFTLAYLIANQNPLLKETKFYKKLEKLWKVSFERAKKLVEKGEIEKAKELLRPFMAVNEKLPFIKLLLKEAEVYNLIKEKLVKKDFKGFFELVEKYPFLKNTKEYEKVINYANLVYKVALSALNNEDFEKVKRAILILKEIKGFEEKAEELKEKLEVALRFLALLNENPQKAIELVDENPFLKELKSYKVFIKKHNEIMEKAEELNDKKEAEKLLKKHNLNNTNRSLKLLS